MGLDRQRVGDSGQALPVMVLVVMITASLLLVAAELGQTLAEAAQARTAADAAALAGRADGRAAAVELATANGGELITFQREGDVVTVSVRVGRVTRRARAVATIDWVRPNARLPGR